VLLLISLYLLLVFVLPLMLSLVVSYRSLPTCRDCPHCRSDCLRIVAPVLARLSAISPVEFQRRWCLGCGWEGVVRLSREPPLPRTIPASPVAGLAVRARASARTLDLRLLTVDGQPWRVLLQCWTEPGRCYGRLVFVAPTGRLWTDALHPFTGSSTDDVLGQALSLPERALATRLREVASE
jgi:hypothetical protein